MMSEIRRSLPVVALTLLAAVLGCGGSGPDAAAAARLTAEQQSWDASHPARYVIGTCGTGFAPHTCRRTAVSDGRVVGAQSLTATWSDVPSPETLDEPVAALFASARAPGHCTTRTLDFAPKHYITEYYLDCGGESYGERTNCFAAETTTLDVCPAPGGEAP